MLKSDDVPDGSLRMGHNAESANTFRKKRNDRSMTKRVTRDKRHGRHTAENRSSADDLEKPDNPAQQQHDANRLSHKKTLHLSPTMTS